MKLGTGIAIAVAFVGAVAAQAVGAHPMAFHTGGFATGIAHPFLGLDHVLAMVAVGVWAAQCGGRARIALPAAFIAAIAAGGALAMAGVAWPHVEAGVAATVLAVGLLIALAVQLPVFAGAALAAIFALTHGYAHGAELPAATSPVAYAAGFVFASALLVAFGVYAGRWTVATPRGARAIGACVAAAGVLMLASP